MNYRRTNRHFLTLIILAVVMTLMCGLGAVGAEASGIGKKKKSSNAAVSAQSQAASSDSSAASAPSGAAASSAASSSAVSAASSTASDAAADITVEEDGLYTDKDHVALYIHTYGHLPDNYITKRDAKKLGWAGHGSLGEVLPGMSIGGSSFGNYEGQLPEEWGREYYECDIDYDGGKRNAKRIVYSDDGLIFYTDDHYQTFTQLY
ncbi:MAG: ribonuclease domain-containing protein [Lachnospiraceae bacterium]|nr:ribonuclease domain-containing protein [Lachnospiraceae bacterium]